MVILQIMEMVIVMAIHNNHPYQHETYYSSNDDFATRTPFNFDCPQGAGALVLYSFIPTPVITTVGAGDNICNVRLCSCINTEALDPYQHKLILIYKKSCDLNDHTRLSSSVRRPPGIPNIRLRYIESYLDTGLQYIV